MKQTFDMDTLLFGVLKASASLSAIGIYKHQRPLNSANQDIVVNTIALSQDSLPQTGTSNINIHVPDIDVKINGVQQKMANLSRLMELSGIVTGLLRQAIVPGIGHTIESQNTIQEADIDQHYTNIRISWNIQN